MSNQNSSKTPTTPSRRNISIDDDITILGAPIVGVHSPRDLLRKMFENQKGEWEICSSDGKVFKFHQSVIEEQIGHFRVLFSHNDTMEVSSKRVNVPAGLGVTGPALEAFLRYFYYMDTTGMERSFSVTCALIRAGHYYNIPDLVKTCMGKIAQFANRVENSWFDVGELWDMYQHVWLWEDTHPHKLTLLDIIADALKNFCKSKEDQRKLLAITNGNSVLRDLILAFAKPKSPLAEPPSDEISYADALRLGMEWRQKAFQIRKRRRQENLLP